MVGRAMLTMVSSSTSMSWAVAITSKARPSLRRAAEGVPVAGALSVWSEGDIIQSQSFSALKPEAHSPRYAAASGGGTLARNAVTAPGSAPLSSHGM
jgi:hypothetical protein